MTTDLSNRIAGLEAENRQLKQKIMETLATVKKMEGRVETLEGRSGKGHEVKAEPKKENEEEEDFELFGDEDDDETTNEEAERVKQARVDAYNKKKENKPVLIAKSSLVLDVKPWDDETNMADLEAAVRSITQDGLLWGASKLVPLAYGIKKLQISAVIEDDKVSVDELEEKITSFEDLIQSMDIAAFNKI